MSILIRVLLTSTTIMGGKFDWGIMSNSISYKHILNSLNASEILLRPFVFKEPVTLFGTKARQAFERLTKQNYRHEGSDKALEYSREHSGYQRPLSRLAAMKPCTADVPIKQPQKCDQCIRGLNGGLNASLNVDQFEEKRAFLCRYLSAHLARLKKRQRS